jgi:hypothetical protein
MDIMHVNRSLAQQPAVRAGEAEFLTVNMVMPAMGETAEGSANFARLLFGLTALALERFGATERNHAPEDPLMSEASRSTELPVNPFDGQILRFRKADSGCQFHSIGSES